MSFVSSKELERKREERRTARREILEKERLKYEGKQKARQRHKDLGLDQWVLPDIEKRLQRDTALQDLQPKPKKHKKKKKKKKLKSSSESEESSGSEPEQWQEKTDNVVDIQKKEPDNWLTFDSIIGNDNTYTSASLKEKKKLQKQEQSKSDEVIGQHSRELNPFWKDGGEGLPQENPEKKNKVHKDWLLRSLKRMNEQAKDQGRSVESIAAERYGSWEEFQRMLRDAEPARNDSRPDNYKSRRSFTKPSDEDDDRCSRNASAFRRPREEDRAERRHDSHRSHRKHDRYSRDHKPSWKKHSREDESKEVKSDAKRKQDVSSDNVSTTRNDIVNSKPQMKSNNEQPPDNSRSASTSVMPAKSTSIVKADQKPEKAKVKPKETLSQPVKILTEQERNQIAAKILKAELMGNKKLAESLKEKLDASRQSEMDSVSKSSMKSTNQSSKDDSSSEEETVVLTRTGKDGQSWPLQQSDSSYGELPNKRRKKTKVPTHKEGERERYFADDDRYSLSDLVRREKTQEAEDQHAMFSRLASNQFKGTDSEYFTLDDMFVSQASRRNTRTEEESRQKDRAMAEHKKLARRLESCRFCFGNKELPKHLLIAIGKKCYLMLPDHRSLSEGHCFIVPMHHCSTGTSLDEDVWYELKAFMRSLIGMFKSKKMDCVFMQTCVSLKKSRHFFIDCVPLPEEEGHLAPIYFKKAIQESESEWSHNKKLVDTRGKDAKSCIPKGLPYFSVDFGMDGGFAHVVEDESIFPSYFGREIVGGMLDVEPRLWRNPPKEHFSEQTKRSLAFSNWYKPYDCTSDMTGL